MIRQIFQTFPRRVAQQLIVYHMSWGCHKNSSPGVVKITTIICHRRDSHSVQVLGTGTVITIHMPAVLCPITCNNSQRCRGIATTVVLVSISCSSSSSRCTHSSSSSSRCTNTSRSQCVSSKSSRDNSSKRQCASSSNSTNS